MGLRHMGVAKESVYGTGVAPTDFLHLISEDLALQRDTEQLDLLDVYSPGTIEELKKIVRGGAVVHGNYQSYGLLLKAFYGGVLTAGASPYTHTFPATGGIVVPRDSLTIEVRKNDALNFRYLGCMVVGFTIGSSVDGAARPSFAFVGKDVDTTHAAATATLPTFNPIRHKDLTLQIDAAAIDCSTFEVTAEFPVDESYDSEGGVLLGRKPEENGAFVVNGRIEAIFSSTVEYLKVQSFANVDISVAPLRLPRSR